MKLIKNSHYNQYYQNNNIIFNKLLKNRIIFLTGYIDDIMSNNIISQLLYLEYLNNKKDIYIYINSPGGIVSSGMSIYDTIKYINPDVNTICIGKAYSMASIILIAGKKKKRFSLSNSSIMIHQPLGKFEGQATDIKIQTNQIIKIKKKLIKIIHKRTEQPIKKIKKDIERDKYFNSKKALKYGIIDKIIKKKKNIKNKNEKQNY